MTIGEIIKSRRTELGLTLEEVGNAVGVGKSTVKKWESGYISNMRRDRIAKLSAVLSLSPAVFITLDTDAEDWNGTTEQSYSNISLSTHETNVITAYRDKPDMQPAVDKLLGVAEEERKQKVYRLPTAARSTSGTEPGYAELTEEQLKKLRAAKGTDNL